MKRAGIRQALPPFRVRFGAGFPALLAVIWFFDTEGLLAAMLPAVAVHELAHMAALIALGCPPRKLTATLTGFSMDYHGRLSYSGELISALSGPAAGLLLSWVCAVLGSKLESRFLLLSAGTGFLLNAFNLLPATPLDGGRALSAILRRKLGVSNERRVMLILGAAVSLALIACGIVFLAHGMGAAMLPAGVWLLVLQKKEYL